MLDALHHVRDNNLGFHEVIVDAEADGALFVTVLAERSKHDDLDVGRLGRVTQDIEHVKTADLWHHGIEKYKIGSVFAGGSKGVFPVSNTADVKAFGLQAHDIDIRERIIIFD